jgi:hypothetical protein
MFPRQRSACLYPRPPCRASLYPRPLFPRHFSRRSERGTARQTPPHPCRQDVGGTQRPGLPPGCVPPASCWPGGAGSSLPDSFSLNQSGSVCATPFPAPCRLEDGGTKLTRLSPRFVPPASCWPGGVGGGSRYSLRSAGAKSVGERDPRPPCRASLYPRPPCRASLYPRPPCRGTVRRLRSPRRGEDGGTKQITSPRAWVPGAGPLAHPPELAENTQRPRAWR